MKSYGAVAASVAANKEKRPELYCSHPRCLWRLSSGPCPKHTGERCDNCGLFRKEAGEFPCVTFEGDSGNPFGKLPIYGLHSWETPSRKPEKGSDEWYEMMDNPKSAWAK